MIGLLNLDVAKLTYLTLLFTTGIYLLQENFTLQERRVNGAHIKPFYDPNASQDPIAHDPHHQQLQRECERRKEFRSQKRAMGSYS